MNKKEIVVSSREEMLKIEQAQPDQFVYAQLPRECLHCGYTWLSRKHNPKQCPRCKQFDWNKEPVTKVMNKDQLRYELNKAIERYVDYRIELDRKKQRE